MEKNLNRNKMNTSLGIGVSKESDVTLNEDTLVGVASAVPECVTPSVVDMTIEMEKISSLEDTTTLGSFHHYLRWLLLVGNSPGKSSYANVTGKPSGKKVNFHTFFTFGSNGIDVVVLVESIHAICERFANTTDYDSFTHLVLLLRESLVQNPHIFVLSPLLRGFELEKGYEML
ncbi:hypothetical protein Tco_0093680 [Tanacetum coccineum]